MAGLVSTNYGEALFDLAKEEDKLDIFKNDLANIDDVFTNNEDLRKLLNHPKIDKEEKKELIGKLFVGINVYVNNFIKILIDKNRISCFSSICGEYIKRYNEYHNIEIAYVQSAKALDDKQCLAIKEMLEEKVKKTIELKTSVNMELIAGVRIKIRDEILDNSALSRLDKMKYNVLKTTL